MIIIIVSDSFPVDRLIVAAPNVLSKAETVRQMTEHIQKLFWKSIHRLNHYSSKCARNSLFSLSNVNICCLSQFFIIVNWISLSFGCWLDKTRPSKTSTCALGNGDIQFIVFIHFVNQMEMFEKFCWFLIRATGSFSNTFRMSTGTQSDRLMVSSKITRNPEVEESLIL